MDSGIWIAFVGVMIGGVAGGLIGVSISISQLTKSLASDSRKVQLLLTDIRDRLGKEKE